jgi:hypothetical protein
MTDVEQLGRTAALDGEGLLPGFTCPLDDVLGAD